MSRLARHLRILTIVLVVLVPTLAAAQTATSTLTGRATDTSGAALPGATVSITSPNLIGGARTTVTDCPVCGGDPRICGRWHRAVERHGLHDAGHRHPVAPLLS